MGIDPSDDDLGPGLHVLRQAEPLKRAGGLAARLRAELCATLPQADTALAERSKLPLVDATTLSTLEVLARRMARSERIAARTRAQAVVDVGHRLAGAGSGLAVHPTTIRERASAVELARSDLAKAERALEDHAAEQAALEERAAAEAAEARRVAAERARVDAEQHRLLRGLALRTRRSRALGALVASLGLGLVLLGLRAVPLWAALLPTLATSLWAMWYLKPRDEPELDGDEDGHAAASELLAAVAASAEQAFSARWSTEVVDQLTLLTTSRDAALEQVRVAERAWRELAGDDVDITELDEVIRRYDPQHEDARLLASETVGVRAAEVVRHHFHQRWVAFWRELGLEAPSPEAGEDAVRALRTRVSRPIVLVGPAAVRGPELARVAPNAPIVVLDGPVEEAEAEMV